jgi:hypothetical protein
MNVYPAWAIERILVDDPSFGPDNALNQARRIVKELTESKNGKFIGLRMRIEPCWVVLGRGRRKKKGEY